MVYLFDKNRYKERVELGLLSSAEKSFINKALDSNWKPKLSKEGTLVKEYKKLMQYYKDEFNLILKEVLNKAEYEKFVKDGNINWINPENNIYVTRRLTSEFKSFYNPKGNYFNKILEQQTDHVAMRMAEKFYKNKKVSKEDIAKKAAELRDDANIIAHSELHNMFGYQPGKYSSSFLKKRFTKLPEFITIPETGKKIKVYETSFNKTVNEYASVQSKFLANLEYFPEYVNLKGFKYPGAKKLINELKTLEGIDERWVETRLKDHLGIDKPQLDYPEGIRFTQKLTTTLAKIQLSFPTSGLKNFVLGTTQTTLAFRMRDVFGGFADVINKDNRLMSKATGATEMGLRIYDGSKVNKFLDNAFFRFGLMRPSEKLNRYVSILAGKRDQAYLARVIKFNEKGSKSYNKAELKLKRFYNLNDKEINLLKKYGVEGVEGTNLLSAAKNKRALDNLYQKMNTFAHINTQGASVNLFMPDWAGKPMAQAALLYKRMAYAATVNTTRNLDIARKNKTLLQPLMFGVGTWMSGETLLWFYSNVLGQEMPKENSEWYRRFSTTLWKGEFLGILSEFFSPFKNSDLSFTIYPSVLSTVALLKDNLVSIAAISPNERDKFLRHSVHDISKGSIGLYNGVTKIYKQGFASKDSYTSQAKRYRALHREFLESMGNKDAIIEHNQFSMQMKRDKQKRAFFELFESGRNKDLYGNSLGKWYVMSLFVKANDIYHKGVDENGISVNTPSEAMKKARKSMENTLNSMNPNKALVRARGKAARKQKIKSAQYLLWLDKEKNLSKGLIKLQNQYSARRRFLDNSIIEYIKLNKLEKDLKYHGVSIQDLLGK